MLKHESRMEFANAFKNIIESCRWKPELVQMDEASKFYYKHVKEIVDLDSTESKEKSCVIE